MKGINMPEYSNYRPKYIKRPYRMAHLPENNQNVATKVRQKYTPPLLDVPEEMVDMSKVVVENLTYTDFSEQAPVTEAEAEVQTPSEYEVIGVKFKNGGKTYFFDPEGVQYPIESNVIVETARGLELGIVSQANMKVTEDLVVLPLRKALRIATESDILHRQENELKEQEAFEVCEKLIEKHGLPMKLVQVEYTFDNSKLLFYFTSDVRVDFRELVKDLASSFKTRIELRQIGIRDEARMLGGLGVCGRPFCCKSFLNDFVQVTIKMAKEQNLSLNSVKISGTCGRLMCCLRYEHEVYEEEIKKTPKVDSLVRTPDGDGVVTEVSPLTATVKVRLSSAPDSPPKAYHRDNVKLMGYVKRDSNTHDSAGSVSDGEIEE